MQNFEFLKEISVQKSYKKGNILFYQGERARRFYLLLSGKVRVYKSVGAKELTLHHFYAGSFIAEMPAFKELDYPASAECESDCALLEIDFKAFKELCLRDNQYSFMMILSLFEKIKILENKLLQSAQSLKARLIHYLLKQNDLSQITQRKIADELGVKAESLSRTLKELKELGLITTNKGKVQICDESTLKEYAQKLE